MADITLEDKVKESFSEGLFIEKMMESALKYMNNTNPVERILKTIDPSDEALRKDTLDRTKLMMNTWLTTYDSYLTAGQSLPVDLIGKAADMAKASRKRYSETQV